jgi:hypothetical protein
MSLFVSGQSGSVRNPETASCLVMTVKVALFSESVVPVLPAIGRFTKSRE